MANVAYSFSPGTSGVDIGGAGGYGAAIDGFGGAGGFSLASNDAAAALEAGSSYVVGMPPGGSADAYVSVYGASAVDAVAQARGALGQGYRSGFGGDGGSALARAIATSATSAADDVTASARAYGGRGGSVYFAGGGGNGGSAAAHAIAMANSATGGLASASALEIGGSGGGVGLGGGGGGGSEAGASTASAKGFSATAVVTAVGGAGGDGGADGGRPSVGANGGTSHLTDAVSGAGAGGGSILLQQTAIGGAGGFSLYRPPGTGGAATSDLTFNDSVVVSIRAYTTAQGGEAGRGYQADLGSAGGSTSSAVIVSGAHEVVVGASAVGGAGTNASTDYRSADASGGNGGSASAVAVGTSFTTRAEDAFVKAIAYGGAGGSQRNFGGAGGSATATAHANLTGAGDSGAATAQATAIAGAGGWNSGAGASALANSAATATGLGSTGTATAISTSAGGIGGLGNEGAASATSSATTAAGQRAFAIASATGSYGAVHSSATTSGPDFVSRLVTEAQAWVGNLGSSALSVAEGNGSPSFDADGRSAYALATFNPNAAFLSPVLTANPITGSALGAQSMAIFGAGVMGMLSTSDGEFFYPNYTSVSTSFTIDTSKFSGPLSVALVDAKPIGAFQEDEDRIEFSVTIGGITAANETFYHMSDAQSYFDDQVLNFTAIPTSTNLIVTINLNVANSWRGFGFGAQFLLGILDTTPRTLTGTPGPDILGGAAGDDVLTGLAGADRIDGSSGTDTAVYSSSPNAVSINLGAVNGLGFSVGKGGDAEGDELKSIENVIGSAFDDHLVGDAGSNTLLGELGSDTLSGGPGADLLRGGGGSDFLDGGDGDDILQAGEGADTLKGGAGNDQLTGGLGADSLNGQAGADIMMGGADNDSYTVDDLGDQVIEKTGEGVDIVSSSVGFALGPNVEKLVLTGAAAIDGTGNDDANNITGNGAANVLRGLNDADNLKGMAGSDTLYGGAGADKLDGGAGADAMNGGTDDDSYIVDDPGDRVIENVGEGTDVVTSSVSFTLGANVENLILSGLSAINGDGNELDNKLTGNTGANILHGFGGADAIKGMGGDDTLYGGSGKDKLDGGQGADAMYGGADNDSYVVDHIGDQVIEYANEGTDTVSATVSFTLSANVENLTLAGSGMIDGTGNNLANAIKGNASANVLAGGLGKDTLTGGAGGDTFLFGPAIASNADKVNDFEHGIDHLAFNASDYGLSVGALGAANLVFGAHATDGHPEFVYDPAHKALYWDPDGLNGAVASLVATFSTPVTLSASDFLILA